MSLLSALGTAILPVLSVAAVGFLLGQLRDIDVDPLGTITIYVLTPALVFYSLATSETSGGLAARLLAGVAVFTFVMVGLSESVGRLLGESEPVLGGLVLSSSFPNAGNYGIPLAAFAFGAVGRSTAVLFIAGQSVLMYTVGVFVASRGDETSARAAATEVFRLPLVYAVAAAWLARWLGVVPPTDTAAMETLRLVGDSAIPVMLLMLGIQLANTRHGAAVSRVGVSNVLKLGVAPLVGVGVALALGLGRDPDVARVFVLECGMPAAITPLILAIEYD
ncbi:permease, partial [Halobacteriales archaeon SW_6_65_15]